MRKLLFLAVLGMIAMAAPAMAVTTGGCGSAAGGRDILVNPLTGDVGTVGMQGVAIRDWSISMMDRKRIRIFYADEAFASPAGDRFVVREGRSLHVFDFNSYRRLAKHWVNALDDLFVTRWHWIEGSDEALAIGVIVRKWPFDMGVRSAKPALVRVNLSTGAESLIALDMPEPLAAAFNRDGSRLAVCFAGGRVEIRSTADGKVVGSHALHKETPWNTMSLSFHPDGRLLGSCNGSELVLYDLEKGQPIKRIEGVEGGKFLRFVLGGRYLIAGDTTGIGFYSISGRRLEHWTAPEGDVILRLHVSEALRKVFTLGSGLACWHTFLTWHKAADAK